MNFGRQNKQREKDTKDAAPPQREVTKKPHHKSGELQGVTRAQ